MGDSDLTKQPISGDIMDVPDIPDPRKIPPGVDPDLVKALYDSFCDSCVRAGLPRPPSWG